MFTRLLSLWVTGALLLLLNWGTTLSSEDYDEDVTPIPDYDYNFTLDYYTPNGTAFNYESYEILSDTKNQGNTDSVSVYRHYGILAGLLVLHFCQQT